MVETLPRWVIWVDPGLMNGYAWYDVREDRIILEEYEGPKCIRMIETALLNPLYAKKTVIGVENFIITSETAKRSQDAKYHIEMMGMIRRVADSDYTDNSVWAFNTKQTSMVVKQFATNRVLKELGWWRLGYDHCHDSARHILYYLAQSRMLNERQKDALVPKS